MTHTIRRTNKNLIRLARTATSCTIRSNGQKVEPYSLAALRGRMMDEIRKTSSHRSDFYQEDNGQVTMIVNGNLTIVLSF